MVSVYVSAIEIGYTYNEFPLRSEQADYPDLMLYRIRDMNHIPGDKLTRLLVELGACRS